MNCRQHPIIPTKEGTLVWKRFLDFPNLRIHKAASAALLVSLLAVACGLGQCEPGPPGVAPTAPATAAPPAPPALAPTAESNQLDASIAGPSASPAAEEPAPTPLVDRADNPPAAEPVTLAPQDEELTTPDVVRLLTPSVVQVLTETLSMDPSNRPVPSQVLGTGVVLS